MKKIFLFIFTILLTCFYANAQSDSVRISCNELKVLNKICNDLHYSKDLIHQQDILIANKDKQILKYQEYISLQKATIEDLNLSIKISDTHVKNIQSQFNRERIYMGITIGGLTISTGVLLYFLAKK